jgi:hypothetical protein
VQNRYRNKFIGKHKVWIAISAAETAIPIFFPNKMVLTKDVYLEKSIIALLIPFICENYLYGVYVFWQDICSPNYSKIAQGFLKTEKFQILPVWINLEKLLNTRLIKDFWGILKQIVYDISCCLKIKMSWKLILSIAQKNLAKILYKA